jgi:hypothetical protein
MNSGFISTIFILNFRIGVEQHPVQQELTWTTDKSSTKQPQISSHPYQTRTRIHGHINVDCFGGHGALSCPMFQGCPVELTRAWLKSLSENAKQQHA